MNRLSTYVTATLVAALLMLSGTAWGATEDLWYEATLSGTFMGYSHARISTADRGTVTTTLTSDLTMRRGEELVTIRGTDVWVEEADGTPVRYGQTRKMAVRTQEMDASLINPGQINVRKSDGVDTIFNTVNFEGELLFPAAIERLHREKGLREGTSYSYKTFDPEFAEIATYEVVVGSRRSFDMLGEPRELTKLTLTCDLYDGLEFIEWRDADGALWREEFPGVGSVRQRTSSDVADREREAGDVLAVTSIASNVAIPRPTTVDDALFEIWLEDGDITESLPEDLRQSIEGTTDRGVLLRVRRVVPNEDEAADFPVRSTPMKEYLDGNALMQTWYPRILGTAAKAVWGAEHNTWRGAAQIERWVYDYVEDRGLGTAFASAREVLESLTGDCSEHAILMATMTRSVAIPSKLVAGIVHYEGEFAYHMWVETWTGGDDWYALDPTIGEGSVDATHIKLAESSVRGGRIAELSLGVMKVFNRLGIRVIEYTVDGETVSVSG